MSDDETPDDTPKQNHDGTPNKPRYHPARLRAAEGVLAGMVWLDTVEGHAYWREVYEKLHGHAKAVDGKDMRSMRHLEQYDRPET